MSGAIITLLTDFGLKDHYVATMKGVILSLCPEARTVDVTHLVSPQDVRSAAYLLGSVYKDFPPGTIHVAVVDPGVGTARRALVMESSGQFFVGPDNGIFAWVLKGEKHRAAWSLENAAYWRASVSSTFHGRDVFAPVAAHLANGTPPDLFGPPCVPYVPVWTSAVRTGDELKGQVIHVDHFGNLITNLSRKNLEEFAPPGEWTVRVGSLAIAQLARTYGESEPGSILALIGSSDYLEISVNTGNAAQVLGVKTGDPVSVRKKKKEEQKSRR